MKRTKMLRVSLVVPLALLAVIPSASAAGAQRWQGMTSQGQLIG